VDLCYADGELILLLRGEVDGVGKEVEWHCGLWS
jgi:hypothetical protein